MKKQKIWGQVLLDYNGDLETLKDLGLTFSQARVYLAAAKLGRAKAVDIWKESGVGRQEVYRILSELLELGLIEKEITKPTQFRATSLTKGLKILLNARHKEISALDVKVRKIKERNKSNINAIGTQEPQFVILPRKYLMENRGQYSYKKAKKNIDFLGSFRRIADAFTYNITVYNEAVKRGVLMNVITDKPEVFEFERLKKEANILFSKKTFNLKFAAQPVNIAISIIDNKEAYFALNPERNIFEDQLLWTNNSTIITLAKEHFMTSWDKGISPEKSYLVVNA